MSKYPYPVLCEEDSSYNTNIKFSIQNVNHYNYPGSITFEFVINMNSATIKNMLVSGQAKMIIKVQTGIFATSFNVDNIEEKQTCRIMLSDIKENDEIKFTAYVIAGDRIIYNANQELIDIYDKDYRVQLDKNAILAISNTEFFSYSTGNNNFIRLSNSSDMNGKGFKICYDENFIRILVGDDFKQAYAYVKNNNKSLCSVFSAHLIFEVFVHILYDLTDRYDDYCTKDWYELFEQCFLQCGKYKTFESFIGDARDGESIDIDIIYEMSHLLTNNAIENSLISIMKMEEG